ncbi:hypothetical protein [Devosia beringensis]|uniref:hypothetical protein n=1 Tax=Devosia beringensis TaxID=2657486 RepID=UPI00186B6E01|nr:hypothetical protein [Devosia beringensis]
MADNVFDEINARLQGGLEGPDVSPPDEVPQVPAEVTEAAPNASPAIDAALLDLVDARIAKLRQPEGAPAVAEQQPPLVAEGAAPVDPMGERIEGTEEDWTRQGPAGFINSIGAGIVDAGFQTKDFFTGEPAEEEKSWFRRAHEATRGDLKENGWVNSLTVDVSQFVTGLVGAGKLLGPLKGAAEATKAGRVGFEVAKGAVAGFFAMDPHEERLSNLIQQYEPLRNPITEYLAAAPGDTGVEGRVKNALEGIGMDLAMVGVFEMSLKAIKAFRNGDEAGAQAALAQVDELQAKADLDRAARESIEGTVEAVDDMFDAAPAAKVADDMEVPTGERGTADISVSDITPAGKGDTPTGAVGDIEPIKSEASAVPLRPQDQTYKPSVEVPEDSVVRIVAAARHEAEVIDRFGSRQAALEAGEPVPRADLPWQKLNATEDVESLIASTTRSIQSQMDAAKGGSVLTDAKVRQMIDNAARHFGADPEVVMGEISKSGEAATHMVADLEASFIISRKLFDDSHALAVRIKAGMLDDFGGDPAAAYKELTRRLTAAADMMAQGASMRAAFGRGLRRQRAEFGVKAADIAKFKDLPPERLVDLLNQTGGDPAKLREMVKPSFMRRVIDEGTFLLTNNLLWNWTTHAVNTSTNLYMLAARPTEKLIGSIAMGSRGSAIRRQAMKEYAYTVYSVSDAWAGMVDAFMRADSPLAPHGNEYTGGGSRIVQPQLGWKPIKSTWDLFYNGLLSLDMAKMGQAAGATAKGAYRTGVGMPTRGLGAVDEFVQQLRYRSVVQARASVEGVDAGLKGDALRNHIKRSLEDAFDAEGRGINNAAIQEARTTTFQQDLLEGTLGKGVQNFRHNWPAAAFILPFVRTPVNVLRYATKMTPGLSYLQKEYRQMLHGKLGTEAQAHAIGQFALGSTFMGVAASLALSGKITGSGPSDLALRKQLQATGWQPYSFVFEGEDGQKTYFPIGRFDPVGMPFGMVADVVDMMVTNPGSKKSTDGIMAIGVALASGFSEKTFLMNLNQVIQAIANPGDGGENIGRYVGNLSSNLIPGSSAIKAYANGDEYMREARTFLDRTMAGMPGYSDKLPPQRDSFGEPIWRKRGLTTGGATDVVEGEHNRIILETGFGIRPPTPQKYGVDLRTVTLSDGRNAYDVYQELSAEPATGISLKEQLTKIIGSPGYARLIDGDPDLPGTKVGVLMDVVIKYRNMGEAQMIRRYPELRQMFSQGQMDHRAQLQEAQRGKQSERPSVRDMLTKMGY